MENGIEKKLFTNDRSVIITTLRHVFSEKIIITAVNNGACTVHRNRYIAVKKELYLLEANHSQNRGVPLLFPTDNHP